MSAPFPRRHLALALLLTLLAAPAFAQAYKALEELSEAFNDVYNRVSPAVVLIESFHSEQFARQYLPPSHPQIPEGDQRSQGSGTIVRSDGYILSNFHVISGADSIRVVMADRRHFRAEVVGYDSLIDVALIKIEAQGLPAIQWADSKQVNVGDWVLAIGHPLGLGTTLTHGIVSALDRDAGVFTQKEVDFTIESFIQTNAVINRGNSGGPLLDLRGRVVGINTAISTPTGFFIGYSLAVPANLAQKAMDDIINYGRVQRGYLGISMPTPADQEAAQMLGQDGSVPRGVSIRVEPDSPAEQGGLRNGDVLLSVTGIPVDHSNQVQTIIYGMGPGERLKLTVQRGAEELELLVSLGEREDILLLDVGQTRVEQLGLVVEDLAPDEASRLDFTPQVAADLGFEPGTGAVIVTGVHPGSQAAERGIQVGDIITEVDRQRVTSSDNLLRSISGLETGETALIWLWRQGNVDVRALAIYR